MRVKMARRVLLVRLDPRVRRDHRDQWAQWACKDSRARPEQRAQGVLMAQRDPPVRRDRRDRKDRKDRRVRRVPPVLMVQ